MHIVMHLHAKVALSVLINMFLQLLVFRPEGFLMLCLPLLPNPEVNSLGY